jgi:hypothetical protein
VFLLELHSRDMHAALGRLLDQARVAGLRLTAVSARSVVDGCQICASIDVDDHDVVERFARRVGAIFCVGAVEVRRECDAAMQVAVP